MSQWLKNKSIAAAGILLASGVLAAACSSDPDPSTTGGGGGNGGSTSQGTGGQGGTSTTQSSSSSSQASSSSAGGGEGGGSCGDTLTDTSNCGSCGNLCAPGQTCEAGACMCDPAAKAAFAADIQPIFNKSCGSAGSCHNKDNPSGGLDLRPGNSYAALVDAATKYCKDGRKRVVPGQPSDSYIVDKLMNTQLCDTANGPSKKMPPNSVLPAADIEKIASWICAGAPND